MSAWSTWSTNYCIPDPTSSNQMKSNKGNKKPGGPSGPPSFSGSRTRIVRFDWSANLVDRAAVSPDATPCVPAVQFPNASDDLTKLSHGPGAGSDDSGVAAPTLARAAPVESIAQYARLGDDPRVDAEFDRFERVAVPMPGGGWFDPINGSSVMPRGVLWESWKAFEGSCASLGRKKKSTADGGIQAQS